MACPDDSTAPSIALVSILFPPNPEKPLATKTNHRCVVHAARDGNSLEARNRMMLEAFDKRAARSAQAVVVTAACQVEMPVGCDEVRSSIDRATHAGVLHQHNKGEQVRGGRGRVGGYGEPTVYERQVVSSKGSRHNVSAPNTLAEDRATQAGVEGSTND